MTEGVTALAAAAILLYVGFWMHGKSHARHWQAYLSKRLQGALSARTMWALAFVSFLAVYREAFETVLFYQALALQAEWRPTERCALARRGLALWQGWRAAETAYTKRKISEWQGLLTNCPPPG